MDSRLKDYLSEPYIMETPVREYGESASLILMEKDLMVRILYPTGGLTQLDQEIEQWTLDTVEYYQTESNGSSADGDAAELTVEYCSYLVQGKMAGVKLSGVYDRSYLAHPVDVSASFNANLETGEFLALTFDDGPSAHTERLLDAFAAHGGKGTFYVVGNMIDNRPNALRRMVEEGHEVGGHSWNHRQLTKLSREDLTDQIMSTRAKIYDVTGVDPITMRPPYGSYNDLVKEATAQLGIAMINWSVDTLDWKYKDADTVYNTIMDQAKDGEPFFVTICIRLRLRPWNARFRP